MKVHTTNISSYNLLRRGKVRDVYAAGKNILLVATDRISAFDVIMNETVPNKGAMLTAISAYWFGQTRHIVANHLISTNMNDLPPCTDEEREQLVHRSCLVRATKPLAIECVVRGYLAGSGWKEYQQSQTVCGIPLPAGMVESQQLPEPVFTPATKAEEGHDENISFEVACAIVGASVATKVRDYSIALYNFAKEEMASKGLILADTKFEFGITDDGEIILIDEALTPDSSRYWLASEYQAGAAQVNFDKQILRDWLETTLWNKQPPPPTLPIEVLEGTEKKYNEAYERIVGKPFDLATL